MTRVTKFTEYINEDKHLSLDQIIKYREKAYTELKKLSKYIDKEFKGEFDKAVEMVKPDLLIPLRKETPLTESPEKAIKKSLVSLIKSMDSELYLPYYGKENEKIIKEDYYRMSKALSVLLFSKIDPKYTKQKLQESEGSVFDGRSKGQLIGSIVGGAAGGALFGPAGVLAGIILGAKPGRDIENAIKNKIDSVKYKTSNIDWQSVAMNIGMVFGTVAGLVTLGGVAGMFVGGVVGGTVMAYLHDVMTENIAEELNTDPLLVEKWSFKDLVSKAKNWGKKFTKMLFGHQRKLEKELKKQYQIREKRLPTH